MVQRCKFSIELKNFPPDLSGEPVFQLSCKPRCKPKNDMATTVNVLCYKSKTLGTGEHPLMVCVCMDGKRKYKSLGVSVRAEHWNFEKNIPKSNCPNKEYINILIANKKKEYETEIVAQRKFLVGKF